MHRRSSLLRASGLVIVPAAFITGCPSDDTAATDSNDSTDSSSGEDDDPTSVTMTGSSMSDTQPTMTTMTTMTGDPDTSGTTMDPDSSTGTETSNGSTESSTTESTASPEESTSTTGELCGNGVVDVGEECDGDDLGGNACSDVGFDAGTLGCNSACSFDTFNCIIYICNNNNIDPTELCDGNDLGGADCESEGYPLGGDLECNLQCDGYDVSGCLTQLCGNDTIEGNEDCDGADLAGQSCASLGYGGGDLACAASCQGFLTAGCANASAQFAYVVNDTSPNSITAYAVASDGALAELPGSPFATGGDSSFDHHPDALVSCGAYVYAANFGSADISGFFVEADGTLTAVAGSPFPQPNVVSLACNDGYLFATDIGTNNVSRFSIADDGSLTSLGSVAAAPSPLGVTLDPVENRLFAAGFGNAISVFDIDDAGDLAPVPGSPFMHGGTNHSASVSPSGAFVASEGNNSVRVWSVAANGSIAEVAGSPFADTSGCEVVGLAWAPDGERLFVGHRNCFPGTISVYDVAGDGALTQVAGSPFLSGGDETVGLAVDESGLRLFASHGASQSTSVFDIGSDGTLTPVAGSPFPNSVVGNHPTVVLRGGGGACQVPFGAPSFEESVSFLDAPLLVQTRMTMAWDGVSYWAASGGSSDGNRLAQFDGMGALLGYFQPGLDLRSAFTKGDGIGNVFLRAYSDAQIYEQTSPGVYGDDVVLAGGVPDAQAVVVYDDLNDYFISHSAGTITRWDATGAMVDTVVLSGYGSIGNEAFSPQNRGVAWSCGYFYTYSDQVLSAWDETGNRVATTTLNGAGTSFDTYYSYSIANGMFFVLDNIGGSWRGYDAI